MDPSSQFAPCVLFPFGFVIALSQAVFFLSQDLRDTHCPPHTGDATERRVSAGHSRVISHGPRVRLSNGPRAASCLDLLHGRRLPDGPRRPQPN